MNLQKKKNKAVTTKVLLKLSLGTFFTGESYTLLKRELWNVIRVTDVNNSVLTRCDVQR